MINLLRRRQKDKDRQRQVCTSGCPLVGGGASRLARALRYSDRPRSGAPSGRGGFGAEDRTGCNRNTSTASTTCNAIRSGPGAARELVRVIYGRWRRAEPFVVLALSQGGAKV